MRFAPLCVLISAGLLSACAGPALKDSSQLAQAAAAAAREQNNDSASQLDTAKNSQQLAVQANLALYSPTYFAQGNDALNKALAMQGDDKNHADITTQAILARSLFERGIEIKQQVITLLQESVSFFSVLQGIDSPNLLSDDYHDVEDDFRKLAVLIETGKTDKVSAEQKDLLKDLAKLEQATLLKAYVSKPEQTLDDAEDDDADDYAEKTFSAAQKALATLKRSIEKSPRELDVIKLQSTQAQHAALHAQQIAKAAAGLMGLKQKETEDKILHMETLLKHIADGLQMEQPVYLSLQEQAFAIAQSAEITRQQAKSYGSQQEWSEEKQQLLGQIKTLNAKIINLEQEKTALQKTTSPVQAAPQSPLAEAPIGNTTVPPAQDAKPTETIDAVTVQTPAVTTTTTLEANNQTGEIPATPENLPAVDNTPAEVQ
jgi:hypothetical protein